MTFYWHHVKATLVDSANGYSLGLVMEPLPFQPLLLSSSPFTSSASLPSISLLLSLSLPLRSSWLSSFLSLSWLSLPVWLENTYTIAFLGRLGLSYSCLCHPVLTAVISCSSLSPLPNPWLRPKNTYTISFLGMLGYSYFFLLMPPNANCSYQAPQSPNPSAVAREYIYYWLSR